MTVDRPDSSAELSETVYASLKAIAQKKLAEERPDHTLQATALVHEAFMRLERGGQNFPNERARFFWAAAEAMRRILIENARAKKAMKRGGGVVRREWAEAISGVADLRNSDNPEEIEALDGAILRLQEGDSRAGDVVRLRFYGGLTNEEVAEALGISARSAKRDWEYARAWLLRELGGGGGGGGAGGTVA